MLTKVCDLMKEPKPSMFILKKKKEMKKSHQKRCTCKLQGKEEVRDDHKVNVGREGKNV
jgi:hypothetical protein